MNPLTAEWVEKAEADFASAGRELRARKQPNYDAACFHAQQCAEKYLKACLQGANVRFGKTHDLLVLLEGLLPLEPTWESLRPDLDALTSHAVNFRYPGASADKELARTAVRQCSKIRDAARQRLGLAVARTAKPTTHQRTMKATRNSKAPKRRQKRR